MAKVVVCRAGAAGPLGLDVMRSDVLILGGGLAGLAAAAALAPRGLRVTLLESRNRLGGRAGSFLDKDSGTLLDNCQHVSMGCCTNFAHFCRTVGVGHYLQAQECLYFVTRDGRVSELRAANWPAPFHLARSFLGAHYLSVTEKIRIAHGLYCLERAPLDADQPFLQWLKKHRQTQRTIDRFWGLVLVSALNETPERIGLRYARKVFVDGFLKHPRGFVVELPVVPLGQLYGKEMQDWLTNQRVELQLQQRVKRLHIRDNRVESVELQCGDVFHADWIVSALPFERLLDVLPSETTDRVEYFQRLKQLETSPITSVHLWLDRPITQLPHAVLLDSVSQWLFTRGETSPSRHYYQIVVSAARAYRTWNRAELQNHVVTELRQFFPGARDAKVVRGRVITEHAATFSAVPGVDRWRPAQSSPLDNLIVTGDWTATTWPATMEGAVRSGYLGAEALLQKLGRTENILQPDLQS